MHRWSLASFPAADQAGRAAIEALDPWLWSIGRRRVDGALAHLDEAELEAEFEEDDPVWDWWGRYENCEIPNLFIYGPVGSGKSGLAWSLLNVYMATEYFWDSPPQEWATWANVVELLDEARAAMSAGERESPIRALYDSALLVLDDLGAERPTDWALQSIGALVQHRHSEGYRPMIVTSNYSPSELARRLGHADLLIGQRIVSRLVDDCVKIRLDRPDLRLGQRLAAV